jgi:hypothetical protein
MGLYFDLASKKRANSGTPQSNYVWNLIKNDRDKIFPKTFNYSTSDGTAEVRELFGDMLDRIDRKVRRDTRARSKPPSPKACAQGFGGHAPSTFDAHVDVPFPRRCPRASADAAVSARLVAADSEAAARVAAAEALARSADKRAAELEEKLKSALRCHCRNC